MKSEWEIRCDFQNAINKAAELEGVASNLRSLANNDLEQSLQTLSNAWKGEAATAYIGKGNRLQERIVANAGKLDRTAQTIRTTAKRTYDAEMEALRIAREREYRERMAQQAANNANTPT